MNSNAHVTYRRMVLVLLVFLLLLALPNSAYLSWKEYVRFAIITTGLLYFYRRKYTHRECQNDPEISGMTNAVSKNRPETMYWGILFAFLYAYIITQFDPATSGTDFLKSRDYINWYSVTSSLVILAIFLITITHSDCFGGLRLRKLDILMISILVAVTLLLLASKLIWSPNRYSLSSYTGPIKIVNYILLWFTVTRFFFSPQEELIRDEHRPLMLSALGFCILVLLSGIWRTTNVFYKYERGEKFLHDSEFEHARQAYLASIEYNERLGLSPIYENSLEKLAYIYLKTDDEKDALATFEKLLKWNSINPGVAYGRIGDVYFSTGRWREAIGEYERIPRIRSNRERLEKLAWSYAKMNKRDKLEGLIKSAEFVPRFKASDDQVYKVLGMALVNTQRWREAQEILLTAEKLNPQDDEIYYGLGVSYFEQGDLHSAFDILHKGLELNPRSADIHYALGLVNQADGNSGYAVQHYEATIKEEPMHIRALGRLSELYSERGDTLNARMMLDRMAIKLEASAWNRDERNARLSPGVLSWNGECRKRLWLYKGRIELVVKATGSPAAGSWPHMIVRLAGQKIGERTISPDSLFYKFEADVKTQQYTILISFDNDFAENGQDRNLIIQEVTITYSRL